MEVEGPAQRQRVAARPPLQPPPLQQVATQAKEEGLHLAQVRPGPAAPRQWLWRQLLGQQWQLLRQRHRRQNAWWHLARQWWRHISTSKHTDAFLSFFKFQL